MRIDVDTVFARIELLIHDASSVASKMQEVINACDATFPHAGWQALRGLSYESDAVNVRRWLENVVRDEPPPFPLRGVWIGIANFVAGGRETADMHFIGSAEYDPADVDQNWAVQADYRPEGQAGSTILDAVYDVAYRVHPELGNDAEWSLCLAYAAFAVADVLRSETPAFLGGDSGVGLVAGFDDGDNVPIGRLTDRGLVSET